MIARRLSEYQSDMLEELFNECICVCIYYWWLTINKGLTESGFIVRIVMKWVLPWTAVSPATIHGLVSLPNSINKAVLTSLVALFMISPPGTMDSNPRQRKENATYYCIVVDSTTPFCEKSELKIEWGTISDGLTMVTGVRVGVTDHGNRYQRCHCNGFPIKHQIFQTQHIHIQHWKNKQDERNIRGVGVGSHIDKGTM